MLELDLKTTALVLIDLQRGIVARQTAPYAAMEVVERCAKLAAACRGKGCPVIYVHVDIAHFQQRIVDAPMRDPSAPPPPPEASELAPEAGWQPGDLLVTKRQWDAFHGTELPQILRERGVRTILIGGIATNFGVESTARTASALGFEVVAVEDVMTSLSAETHQFAITNIFPRLGRVRKTDEVLAAVGS